MLGMNLKQYAIEKLGLKQMPKGFKGYDAEKIK